MSRKKMKPVVIDAMVIWEARKPKYDGFMCGHGIHRDKSKYSRKQKYKTIYM